MLVVSVVCNIIALIAFAFYSAHCKRKITNYKNRINDIKSNCAVNHNEIRAKDRFMT
jgi:hypothetical protein